LLKENRRTNRRTDGSNRIDGPDRTGSEQEEQEDGVLILSLF
jgi:hypothetical protein